MVDASLSTSTTLQFLTPDHAHQNTNVAAPPSASATSSNSSLSSGEEQPSTSQPQQRRRGRGLSLSIGEVVSSAAARNKRHSTGSQHPIVATSSPPPASAPCNQKPNELFIEVEGGQQMIVRPNRIIRGNVVLHATSKIYATQIRVKFRAEEIATVKIREAGESKLDRIDQLTTTYFEANTKVWGNDASEFSVKTWEALEPGEHFFPFALKFPNVNYPPSVDEPSGFSIRYIWSAHLDGAAFQPGLRSKEFTLPYRPIICAPPAQEWTFTEFLYKQDRKTPLAHVKATLPQQVFCPDEAFDMMLEIESVRSDMIVTDISYMLRKHYDGQLRLQQGTARKSSTKVIMKYPVPVRGNDGSVRLPIHIQMPTRLVSPSFVSKNLRVYYGLVFTIVFANPNSLLKSTQTTEVVIPLAVANLPNEHLLRIPDLTAVQGYQTSRANPLFFDPTMDEPPPTPSSNEHDMMMPLTTPPLQSPPNYFSLPSMPPQLVRHERKERTVFTTRVLRPGYAPELGEPATIYPDVRDEDW